jgi:hypothetical protein
MMLGKRRNIIHVQDVVFISTNLERKTVRLARRSQKNVDAKEHKVVEI